MPDILHDLFINATPSEVFSAVTAPGAEFELRITRADEDWTGTLVGFSLEEEGGGTKVSFSHRGWPGPNAHFRRSSYCWAMYLRVLKRFVEAGETVEYEKRTGA